MLLLDRPIHCEIAGPRVFIFHRRQQEIGEIVKSLDRQRPLHIHSGKPQGMRRNFNVLATAKLAHRFQHLGLVKFENEMNLLAVMHEVVTVGWLPGLGIIEREALALTEQECLDIARGLNLKTGGPRSQEERASGIDLDLDSRGLGRLLFCVGFRLDAIARQNEN